MARWDGQFARYGITVQAQRNRTLQPGWMDGYVQRGTGIPGWMGQALINNGVGMPRWASQIPDGREIYIYDLHRGHSRISGHGDRRLDLNADINIGGMSNRFVVDVSAANVNRRSNKGLNNGARRGNITCRIRAWASDNGQLLIDQGSITSNVSDGIYKGPYKVSGWDNYWHPWSRTITASRAVGRILVNIRVIFGVEDYHSIGDGSPNGNWNPHHTIGAYYQYNYFDLIHINAIPTYYSSYHQIPKHNTNHGVERERHITVVENNGAFHQNVHRDALYNIYTNPF